MELLPFAVVGLLVLGGIVLAVWHQRRLQHAPSRPVFEILDPAAAHRPVVSY